MNRKYTYRSIFLIIVSLGIFWEMAAAHADEFWRKAILACSKDTSQFVVRFGTLWNDDTIEKAELVNVSPQIENLYKNFSIAQDGKCELPNGKKIAVSTYSYQAYAYGMGGADPDTAFTLKIDDRLIYYKKKFYLGYGVEKQDINGIFYDEGHLYEDVSSRLKPKSPKYPEEVLSQNEQRELSHDKLRDNMKENLSDFCKGILEAERKPEYSKPERIPLGFLSSFNFDLNNDGRMDKVFRIGGSSADCGVGCGTHYFDGSFLIAFTGGEEKVPQFIEDINNAQKGRDDDYPFNLDLGVKSLENIPDWNAQFISYSASGNTARYIYNVPFGYKGTNYIYAFEVKENALPRRSIVKMTPDNKLIPVCKYAD